MPTYEYLCRACGERLEIVQSFADAALTTCASCGGELRKVFSAAGLIFKGSGWHVKDYASSASAASSGGSTPSAKEGPSDGASSTTSASNASGASGASGASDPSPRPSSTSTDRRPAAASTPAPVASSTGD